MPKQVKIVLARNGKMAVDFEGFQGEECFSEAARINQILAQFGIKIDQTALERKTPVIPDMQSEAIKTK